MIRSLLWKEWREQGWRIAFGCVMVGAFTALGLNVRILPDIAIVMPTMIFGSLLLPLLMSMGLTAPEQSDGTLPVLLSIPVAPWKTLVIKLVAGTAGCILPLATGAALTAAIARSRELAAHDYLWMYAATSVFSVVLLLWLVAFGVKQPTEARVGLVGIGLLVFFGASAAAYGGGGHRWVSLGTIALSLWAINPLALMEMAFDQVWRANFSFRDPKVWHILCAQLLVVIFLFSWTVYRFERLGRARS
jgi:hypothetical protein